MPSAPARFDRAEPIAGRFALAELAAHELAVAGAAPIDAPIDAPMDLTQARNVKRAVDQAVHAGRDTLQGLAAAIAVEIAIAETEEDGGPTDGPTDPERIFRLQASRWGVEDLAGLAPLRDPDIRVLTFAFDASTFIGAQTLAELPAAPAPGRSFMVAFRHRGGPRRSPLLVDELTARILALSDGTRTVAAIRTELHSDAGMEMPADEWIEQLFVRGLISLRENPRLDRSPVATGAVTAMAAPSRP